LTIINKSNCLTKLKINYAKQRQRQTEKNQEKDKPVTQVFWGPNNFFPENGITNTNNCHEDIKYIIISNIHKIRKGDRNS
jgi:hypothetical protein